MTRTLKDFLTEKAEELRREPQKSARVRDEWVAAVTDLLDRLAGWLRESDPGHVLAIRQETLELREEGIGFYEVPGLTIALGPRIIWIHPIARYVAGPLSYVKAVKILSVTGRVDLTNGLETFSLFRVAAQWFLYDRDTSDLTALDRASFEASVQRLLE